MKYSTLNENVTVMDYWKLLGLKEKPTGIGKVMSICMLICLVNGYFLELFVSHIVIDIIVYSSVIVFVILLFYNLIFNRK